MKFKTKLPVAVAKTVEGKEATEKSAAFVPEIVAEAIFNVFKVPRFTIVKVEGVIDATEELVK